MADWSNDTIVVVGDNAERVLALNERRVKIENTDPQEFEFLSNSTNEEGHKDYLILRRGHAGFEPATHDRHVSDLYEGPPALWLSGERTWGPPLTLVKEWSEEFPDLTFYVHYENEGIWDAGTYRIKNGKIDLIEHRVGWFMATTKPNDEPVHHFVVAFADDPANLLKVKQLAEAKTIFHTETTDRYSCPWNGDVWAFRCAPEQLLKEGVKFAYDPVAYTLDEEVYLGSMYDRAKSQEYRGAPPYR
jgi:hypothetical protein